MAAATRPNPLFMAIAYSPDQGCFARPPPDVEARLLDVGILRYHLPMPPPEASVEAVARAALADPAAQLLDWSEMPLGGGLTAEIGTSGGVLRVRGRARSRGQPVSWSAIQKLVRPSAIAWGDGTIPRDDPRGFEYWRREPEAYRDGLLDELGPRLSAPRCFGVHEDDLGMVIWIEDVDDDGPEVWGLDDYREAARALGGWNGTYLVGRPLPERPWFTRSRIPDWLELGGPGIEAMSSARRTGLLEAWLDDAMVRRLQAQWTMRDRLIEIRERLPQTLCHHDATRRNLAFRGAGAEQTVVAIDWQFIGAGHLGDEIAAMVTATLQFLDVPANDARAFGEAALDGYVDGLRDAGWTGARSLVELGFKASAALLMGLGGAGLWFEGFRNGLMTEALAERIVGRSVDELGAAWPTVQSYFLDLGDEALELSTRLD